MVSCGKLLKSADCTLKSIVCSYGKEMKFGIFDVIVFYKFVDEVTPEYSEEVQSRISQHQHSHVYVCPNSHPEFWNCEYWYCFVFFYS